MSILAKIPFVQTSSYKFVKEPALAKALTQPYVNTSLKFNNFTFSCLLFHNLNTKLDTAYLNDQVTNLDMIKYKM